MQDDVGKTSDYVLAALLVLLCVPCLFVLGLVRYQSRHETGSILTAWGGTGTGAGKGTGPPAAQLEGYKMYLASSGSTIVDEDKLGFEKNQQGQWVIAAADIDADAVGWRLPRRGTEDSDEAEAPRGDVSGFFHPVYQAAVKHNRGTHHILLPSKVAPGSARTMKNAVYDQAWGAESFSTRSAEQYGHTGLEHAVVNRRDDREVTGCAWGMLRLPESEAYLPSSDYIELGHTPIRVRRNPIFRNSICSDDGDEEPGFAQEFCTIDVV